MKRSKYSLEAYAILATSFVGLNKLNAQVTILDFDQDLRIVKWNSPFISHDTLRIDIDDNGIDDLVFDYESSGGYASIGVEIYDKVIAIGAEEDYELYDLNAYNVYALTQVPLLMNLLVGKMMAKILQLHGEAGLPGLVIMCIHKVILMVLTIICPLN
ncbi:MAG: hypothetical protein IPH42_11175 [Bacteroidetes bacterium]|nr:hypothetical protein [Bacteroidota bacterium]